MITPTVTEMGNQIQEIWSSKNDSMTKQEFSGRNGPKQETFRYQTSTQIFDLLNFTSIAYIIFNTELYDKCVKHTIINLDFGLEVSLPPQLKVRLEWIKSVFLFALF